MGMAFYKWVQWTCVSKKTVNFSDMDEKFLEERKKGLEKYMKEIFENTRNEEIDTTPEENYRFFEFRNKYIKKPEITKG